MKKRIISYETEEVNVTWDQKRCIHAAECIRGLPEVFDTSKRRWIQPEKGDINKLTQVIERCPTGALHYELKKSDNEEKPPVKNTITIRRNGPIYIHGNILLRDSEGNIILKDTRVAMCRCGKSGNKPLCDNSHLESDFEADTSFDTGRLEAEPMQKEGGELNITLRKNASFLVEGNYELTGRETGKQKTSKKMSFCRCGSSSTKPFCDGTHREINFTAE